MYQKLSSSWTFDATAFIRLLLYANYKEKETLNEKFKAIANMGIECKAYAV